MVSGQAPRTLDYSHTRTSESGVYRATIATPGDSIPTGKLQSWTLHLETADGGTRLPLTSRNEISRVYANIGKAIAASCVNCHNGPLFTDNHFHNTGVPRPPMALSFDSGRTAGIRKALVSEFSCTSRYSDAKRDDCAELRFAGTEGPELLRAYKPPSLRNVTSRAPYMLAGQLASLAEVLQHYSDAPIAPSGHSELKPLHLSATERGQIVAFLGTLSGSLSAPPGYLTTPPMPRATELSQHD
ncbi:MAG: hypothetical protein ABIQ10_01370 [Gemmatimonadaceae bacterium]